MTTNTDAPMSFADNYRNVVRLPGCPAIRHVLLDVEGYLIESPGSCWGLPTYREAWAYDDLSWDDQIQALIDVAQVSDSELATQFQLERQHGEWTIDQHREFEDFFLDLLEYECSFEELPPELQQGKGPERAGHAVLAALSDSVAMPPGLNERERLTPDGPVRAVHFNGDPAALNAALRRAGSNIVVLAS